MDHKDYLETLKKIDLRPKKTKLKKFEPQLLNEQDKVTSDIHAEIAKFFVKNPSPSNNEIEKFCEEMGIDQTEFVRHIYMIIGELAEKGFLKGYVNESILHELFINMAELNDLDGIERDKKMLRLSMVAELDATNLYEKMANLTDNPNIKKVMLDVAKEEKVHAGEFETLLKKIDPGHEPAMEEGEGEVDELAIKENESGI
ncbi:MAG: ferritin family protein [Candidatus Thorarchaeota archaeon]|jgi:hypothetical protein